LVLTSNFKFCKDPEWKDDTTFPKVRSLSMQALPYLRWCAIIFKENVLPKFPNLEFLELQRFFDIPLNAESEMSIQADVVRHIQDLNYFQVCPKLKTVAVTNNERENQVAVDKETYERMAATLNPTSYPDSSDSDSSANEEELQSSASDSD